jgi:hypothetical protein
MAWGISLSGNERMHTVPMWSGISAAPPRGGTKITVTLVEPDLAFARAQEGQETALRRHEDLGLARGAGHGLRSRQGGPGERRPCCKRDERDSGAPESTGVHGDHRLEIVHEVMVSVVMARA